jgi:hypothetical protein
MKVSTTALAPMAPILATLPAPMAALTPMAPILATLQSHIRIQNTRYNVCYCKKDSELKHMPV